MYGAPAQSPWSPAPDEGAYGRPAVDVPAFMRTVYGWMGAGLGLTGLVAAYVASDLALAKLIWFSPLRTLLLIGQIIMVMVFSGALRKVSFATAATMFAVYCAMSGLTFSIYFLAFAKTSIAITLWVTGGMFAGMSAFGTLSKQDLSRWGSLAIMGLFGLILAGVVNLFFHSGLMSLIASVVAVFVFTALTAYDTQKIRQWAQTGDKRLALLGALELYLDFINLFVALLQIFGGRRR